MNACDSALCLSADLTAFFWFLLSLVGLDRGSGLGFVAALGGLEGADEMADSFVSLAGSFVSLKLLLLQDPASSARSTLEPESMLKSLLMLLLS